MNNQKGFTMVEVLGVVAVLAIISLFTFPIITSLMNSSSTNEKEQFLNIVYNAAEIYIEINYDKFSGKEEGYISSKKLVEEGLLQNDLINPETKEKVYIEDGIIEVSRDIDNSFKFEYVTNQYINIYTIQDLTQFLNSNSDYKNKTVILNKDIDINTVNLYKKTPFSGTFDGNGYTISNISINSAEDNIGLFSSLLGATIKNIKLVGTINGKNNVGLLAGSATNSNIKNIDINAKFDYNGLITSGNVGGLIGYGSNVQIKNITSTSNLIVNGDNIGGIVGKAENASSIKQVLQNGYVSGSNSVGGIIGNSSSTIIEEVNSSIKTMGVDNIGGIVGYSSNDKIYNSNSNLEISGSSNIGGIVGYAQGGSEITKNKSVSKIVGEENVGGLAGTLSGESKIQNCYSIGNVSSESQIGGLIGSLDSSIVENSYYAGVIMVTSQNNIGGLVGLAINSEVNDCYYNSDLIEINAFGVTTNSEIDSSKGLSTLQMKTSTEYKNWDFVNIWQIENTSYPTLRQ